MHGGETDPKRTQMDDDSNGEEDDGDEAEQQQTGTRSSFSKEEMSENKDLSNKSKLQNQQRIEQLERELEKEKGRVRDSNNAYSAMQARYKEMEDTLSQIQNKEHGYIARIQELQKARDDKYNTLLQEKDSLKIIIEELKARLHRQEQYHATVSSNPNPPATAINNDHLSEKKEEYLAK
ncbi:putative chimeric erythrocyte-binding protein, partial [Reticulomyxa filosa]